MEFTALNEQELVESIYKELEASLKAGFRVGLIGDLGAGKTALTRGILKKLGVNEPVTSPTFTLRKFYTTSSGLKVQHIDLYRQEKDVNSYEVEEWLRESEFLTFVEWIDNLSKSSGLFDVVIKLEFLGDTKRKVELIWN